MANILKITVDNPGELLNAGAYGAGAVIRVQTGAALAGPFGDLTGTGSTPTVPLVDGTTAYTAYDPNGVSSSWYRQRYENVGASRVSDWSDAFQVGRQLYAELEDLNEYLNLPQADDKANLLLDLLNEATGYLSSLCERDFFKHPQSGTEVRLFNGTAGPRLRVKAGIVSLTQVRWASSTGSTLEVLPSTDYQLGPLDKPDNEPYEWMYLSDASSSATQTWPPGINTVELTGQFGWPQIPAMIRKATLDLAREWYRQGPGGGGPVGINQFGTPIFGGGLPLSVKDAVNRYSARSVIH